MDKRLTPFNGRVAHVSLRGKVDAEEFVEGETFICATPFADVMSRPKGARQCQLVFGQSFEVLDCDEYHAFGFRKRDGYIGWVSKADLVPPSQSSFIKGSFIVIAPRAEALREPDFKTRPSHSLQLSIGSIVCHRPLNDQNKEQALQKRGWTGVLRPTNHIPEPLYVPSLQLGPAGQIASDPVSVAETLIHTPYVWGGDTGFGIDCSGLVQVALHMSGMSCPRDSDQQEAAFPDATGPYQRGDLLFWKGHVAMVTDPDTIIHANAHHMAVAYEPIATAIARIEAQGDGPVTSHKRPSYGAQT